MKDPHLHKWGRWQWNRRGTCLIRKCERPGCSSIQNEKQASPEAQQAAREREIEEGPADEPRPSGESAGHRLTKKS